MRYAILSFCLMLTACSNGDAIVEREWVTLNDPMAPSPEMIEVVSGVKDEPKAPEPEIDELTDCPSPGFNHELLDRTIAAMVDPANKGRFLLWENDYDSSSEQPDNIRVVFVYEGTRYTVWHNPDSTTEHGHFMEGWVSVWERPEGTQGQDDLITYSDHVFTGCVNFGVGGPASLNPSTRKTMRWNDIGPDNGVEHHAHWQDRYNHAMLALAKTVDAADIIGDLD